MRISRGDLQFSKEDSLAATVALVWAIGMIIIAIRAPWVGTKEFSIRPFYGEVVPEKQRGRFEMKYLGNKVRERSFANIVSDKQSVMDYSICHNSITIHVSLPIYWSDIEFWHAEKTFYFDLGSYFYESEAVVFEPTNGVVVFSVLATPDMFKMLVSIILVLIITDVIFSLIWMKRRTKAVPE